MNKIEHLIDMAGMKAVVGHLQNDPEIKEAIQVFGDKNYLAEVGEMFVDGYEEDVQKAIDECKIQLYRGGVPITNAVYCLYLPPFYLFVDLKKTWS